MLRPSKTADKRPRDKMTVSAEMVAELTADVKQSGGDRSGMSVSCRVDVAVDTGFPLLCPWKLPARVG